ncbi:MAG: cyanoexosortase, partial [Cyanobacteriota bacterium]
QHLVDDLRHAHARAQLQAFGQADHGHPGAYVLLPAGAVWVGPGCSGFSMALVLLGTGFLIGKFTGMTWRKTLGIMLIGWFLAMIFNVPRIMLLAIASVYWGKQSFEFWHGPIGGQIFAGVLFTIYYYAAMWIIDRRSISA